MAVYEVDPISRIEGHLGVKVTTGTGGAITEADAHGNLWRGFENFLIGRRANDAITFTQRICGVCPVPHGTAATLAADSVLGVSKGYTTFAYNGTDGIPEAGLHIRNIILASEFLMSSITHFYHLAAQSYIQGPAIPPWTPYFNDAQYHPVLRNSLDRAIPASRAAATIGSGANATVTVYGTDTAVTIQVVAPTVLGALSVAVATKAITVTLAHDGTALIDAANTATLVAAAINASGAASALVRAVAGGDGTGVVTATASRPLVVEADSIPVDLWSAVIKQYVKALRIRRLTFEAGAMFAGRMPMVSSLVAGGTTNAFESAQELRDKLDVFRAIMEEVGVFVAREYIPLALALGVLYPDYDNSGNTGHTAMSTHPTTPGQGRNFGAGLGNFLSWGAFPQGGTDTPAVADKMALKGGWKIGTSATINDLLVNRAGLDTAIQAVKDNLTESIDRSRYAATNGYTAKGTAVYPGNVTATEPDRDGGYSWMKAPRWNGYAMEVGPLARMVISGKYPVDGSAIIAAGGDYAPIYLNGGALDTRVLHPDLVAGLDGNGLTSVVAAKIGAMVGGLSTMDRLRARAIESFWMVAFLIGAPSKDTNGNLSFPAKDAASGNGWVGQLRRLAGSSIPEFYRATAAPTTGSVSGFGLVEAPRGSLGHFVTADNGKIRSYQCVVPTTWNGSPKNGTATSAVLTTNKSLNTGPNRGAIEQAMIDVTYDSTVLSGAHTRNGRQSGVEVLRVAQSFDPCIACAVH